MKTADYVKTQLGRHAGFKYQNRGYSKSYIGGLKFL